MPRAFAETTESDVIVDSARGDLIQYTPPLGSTGWVSNANQDVAYVYDGSYSTSSTQGDTISFKFTGTPQPLRRWLRGS